MLKYFLINILLLTTILQSVCSQETKKEELPHRTKQEGLSLGVDIAPLIDQLLDPSRKGINFTGRINFKEKWFGVAEAGYENFNYHSERFNYLSNGTGIKVGVDYDVFNPDEEGNNDNILFGARYGFGWQQHSSSSYTITNGYWNDAHGSVGAYGLYSHYVEFLFGLRTEVFKNFFMGVSLRAKGLIYTSNSGILEPTSIPGYGRPDPINFGFEYNLEYQIPYFWKKKKPLTHEKLL